MSISSSILLSLKLVVKIEFGVCTNRIAAIFLSLSCDKNLLPNTNIGFYLTKLQFQNSIV